MSQETSCHRRILQAAYRLFVKQGIDATSTKEIAKAAEVNEVTIFRIFKSKKDLAAAIISKYGSNSVVARFDQLNMSEDLEENLRALAATLNNYYLDNKIFMKFVFNNLTNRHGTPYFQKMLDPMFSWLDNFFRSRTKVSAADCRRIAVEFTSPIAMRSIRRAITNSTFPFPEDDQEFVSYHARIFAAAIRDLYGSRKG
jgi:AcrR family transcriptional regulator